MKNEFSISTPELIAGLRMCGLDRRHHEMIQNKQLDMRIQRSFDFAKSIIKQAGYGKELSVAQKRVGIEIICRYASKDLLRSIGIEDSSTPQTEGQIIAGQAEKIDKLNEEIASLESTVKQLMESLDDENISSEDFERITRTVSSHTDRIKLAKQELLRVNMPTDRDIKSAAAYLKPFFLCEQQDLQKLVEKISRYERLVDWSRGLALEFLSNYREQLPSELRKRLLPILPAESERDKFFLVYTPKYVDFLLYVAKYAIQNSIIAPDKKLDEFLRSEGRGPPPTSWKIGTTIDKWKDIVEHVRRKLERKAKDGSLSTIGGYIESPNTFEEAVVDKDPETATQEILRELSLDASTNYTDKQKSVALELIQYLASICDYAHALDYNGFNATDTYAGHEMAKLSTLSDAEMPRAVFWCRKYRKQLPADKLSILNIGNKAAPKVDPAIEKLKEIAAEPEKEEEFSVFEGQLTTSRAQTVYLARYFKSSF